MCGGGDAGGSSNDNSSWGAADRSDAGPEALGSQAAVDAANAAAAAANNNSSWGAQDAIDMGAGLPGSQANIDAAQMAAEAQASINSPGEVGMYSGQAKPEQTFDRENGWGLGFADRAAFGGWGTALSSGGTNLGAFGNFVGTRIDKFLDNPWASIIDTLVSLAPTPAGPLGMAMGIGKGALSVGSMLGLTPSIGEMATSAARSMSQAQQVDPQTGQPISDNSLSNNPFGGSDTGGNDWTRITDALPTDTSGQSGLLASSTAPTTISSTDQRTSYGFSGGQGVDYADLSAGFGGTNVGARGGWRTSGAGGWG